VSGEIPVTLFEGGGRRPNIKSHNAEGQGLVAFESTTKSWRQKKKGEVEKEKEEIRSERVLNPIPKGKGGEEVMEES